MAGETRFDLWSPQTPTGLQLHSANMPTGGRFWHSDYVNVEDNPSKQTQSFSFVYFLTYLKLLYDAGEGQVVPAALLQ